MPDEISYEDVVLETLPFGDELKTWCKSNSEFYKALKVIYSERFIHLGAIIISQSPNYPDDEVIGIIAYDYGQKNPRFKQDFIINKGGKSREFLLYTRNPYGNSKYVKDISEFYSKYGKDGNYADSHHLSLEMLPNEIRPLGERAIKQAERIKSTGFIKPSPTRIKLIYEQILDVKKKQWLSDKKIKNPY